jgi:hypothetical protein
MCGSAGNASRPVLECTPEEGFLRDNMHRQHMLRGHGPGALRPLRRTVCWAVTFASSLPRIRRLPEGGLTGDKAF